MVYRELGRFGGWPANHGVWSRGQEILVGFSAAYSAQTLDHHPYDNTRPEEPAWPAASTAATGASKPRAPAAA